jgi:membrane protein YqaA with SNARE-associated domain
MIHDIKDYLIEWSIRILEQMGMWGLFVFSYTESLFHPIPVDPILLAMQAMGEWSMWDILFWATLGSLLGGMTAHFLGAHLGKKIFVKFFGIQKFEKGKKLMEKWGVWGVIFAAVTPVPYKVMGWLAGILHMPLIPFALATVVGRGLRFAFVLGVFELLRKLF